MYHTCVVLVDRFEGAGECRLYVLTHTGFCGFSVGTNGEVQLLADGIIGR